MTKNIKNNKNFIHIVALEKKIKIDDTIHIRKKIKTKIKLNIFLFALSLFFDISYKN
ncbi:hypothetical protein MDPP_0061 [Candidatus Phytoplasma pini]|uniref:Uncharacterized protein n=1 Tax=Candidatus Phytoplasma pini TaxID=267362 RepID=A0A559KJY7_9MOLU|nr:hypothetical protein MDPP_0061 [Candidatus Phytoplasma pini]